MSGAIVDKIVALVPPILDFQSLNDGLRELALLTSKSTIYKSEDAQKEAILRTSTANSIRRIFSGIRDEIPPAHLQVPDSLLTHTPDPVPREEMTVEQEGHHEWEERASQTDIPDDTSDDREEQGWSITFSLPSPHMEDESTMALATSYLGSVARMGRAVRVFVTQRGYLGIGSSSVGAGDIVSIFSTTDSDVLCCQEVRLL
ncbi:MAG: hypothetical protein LQ340_006992 [Diploschistes diacapsis]|nr:MAG: hypothetical protein LQ340_006992 [Diploschistes diacapsis]